jgi:predicted molibdopterin-dependent oxidoreductase YjgC
VKSGDPKNPHIRGESPDSQLVVIRVDSHPVPARRGQTLLAALHAAGVRVLRRSDRLGEPRGALCGMGVCFECRVTVNGQAGVQACMTEVEDGMEIETHGD